jgi:hypothetical protein
VGTDGSGVTGGGAGTGTFNDSNTYQGGGANGVNNTAGSAGTLYGGAGSGGEANTAADRLGGDGRNGIVVLTWTDPPTSTNVCNMVIAA